MLLKEIEFFYPLSFSCPLYLSGYTPTIWPHVCKPWLAFPPALVGEQRLWSWESSPWQEEKPHEMGAHTGPVLSVAAVLCQLPPLLVSGVSPKQNHLLSSHLRHPPWRGLEFSLWESRAESDFGHSLNSAKSWCFPVYCIGEKKLEWTL